jgi:hypothetical protein
MPPSVDDLDSFSRSPQTPPEMLPNHQRGESNCGNSGSISGESYGDQTDNTLLKKYHLQQDSGNQYRIYDEKKKG